MWINDVFIVSPLIQQFSYCFICLIYSTCCLCIMWFTFIYILLGCTEHLECDGKRTHSTIYLFQRKCRFSIASSCEFKVSGWLHHVMQGVMSHDDLYTCTVCIYGQYVYYRDMGEAIVKYIHQSYLGTLYLYVVYVSVYTTSRWNFVNRLFQQV